MASIARKRQREIMENKTEISPTTEDVANVSEPSKEELSVPKKDEYEHDSSDEEDVKNTIGNVPLKWYDEYEHIGYDVQGEKITKPKKGDEIDEFLQKNDNPNYWRTVIDPHTGKPVVLTDEDITLVKNFVEGRFTEPGVDPYPPAIDFFTYEKMIHPVTNHPDQKRSFIPSKLEMKKVGQFVDALKSGRMKMSEPEKDSDEELDEKLPTFYQLWSNDGEASATRRYRQFIPAPKNRLPGHAESYNPPPEYLFDEQEKQEWEAKEPSERRLPFIPKSHSSLREVCGYPKFVNDVFRRCLDLYLLPRQVKMRPNIRAEDLLPKLPQPRDLQPFPTTQAMVYEGHTGPVLCISVEPSGHRLVSGSADNSLRVWDVASGRCLGVVKFSHAVKDVAWNPSAGVSCIAAAVNNEVMVVETNLVYETENGMLHSEAEEDSESSGNSLPVTWTLVKSGSEYENGIRLKITHPKVVHTVVWHRKGDYFAVVMKEAESMPVFIHQLSKRKSQNPLKKPKDPVQTVIFHPTKPYFFVATQRYVKQYDLMKQELMKKLLTNCQWVSSVDIHPGGENLILGSYDKRFCWFDLALSAKPYKMLKHHQKAIRQVCYHRTYPLFASASDDGTVIICHGMVYNDFALNPLIVPVKILRGHKVCDGIGVLDCEFHPKQPWIFSAGADCTVRLFY